MAVGIFFADYANSATVIASGGVYDDVHDSATGSLTLLSNINDNSDYWFCSNRFQSGSYDVTRWLVNIDCANLPAGASISSAKFHFPVKAAIEEDTGHSDVDIVEGVFGTPPITADFFNQLSKVTAGGTMAYPPDDLWPAKLAPVPTTLNATGLGWITKAGDTKLCLRIRGDVDDSQPPGTNRIRTEHSHIASGDQKEVDFDDEEITNIKARTAVFTGTLVGFRSPFLEVEYTSADSPTYPRYRVAYSDDLGWTEENIIRTDWQTGIAVRDEITATMTALKSNTQYLALIETEKSAGSIYDGTGKTFTTASYPSGALTRVTALVGYWKAGPNAVNQLQIMLGGLSSQYFSPVSSVKTPEPTIPREIPPPPVYQPTLEDYGKWLVARTHEQQVAVFGETVISFGDWQRWAMNELAKGRSIR